MRTMILDNIADSTRKRVADLKQKRSLASVKEAALALPASTGFPFLQALKQPDISFICEVKKASPSKGVIAEHFPYLEIAEEYEAAGASAISVLTEPEFFLGKDLYLKEIAKTVKIPVLRKDFTIDAYQIYEAKLLGASAVLLICALLELPQLKEYMQIARELGLSSLVETHTQQEVEMALQAEAEIIGINNRNLYTFEVDIQTSLRLRKQIPDHILCVSESGIRHPADIAALRDNGTDAVLIGEAFMRSPDKKQELAQLRGVSDGA